MPAPFQNMATNDTNGPIATIAINTALSDAITLTDNVLCAVEFPGTWTAASLSFSVSWDGSTYTPLYIVSSALAATEYAITSPAASITIALDPAIFASVRYVKLRSGTAAATVNQAAARSIRLITRPV